MNRLLKIVLILLVVACVFDPADKLLGLKMPLFVLAWILFLFGIALNHTNRCVSRGMVVYLILFLLIPLISISHYFLTGGDSINYNGFQYLKSYLFITVTFILCIAKINLIKPTVVIITALSILALIIIIASRLNTLLVVSVIVDVGQRYGILSLGSRLWGASVFPDLPGVYFHTAELIILPVGYFTMKTIFSKGCKKIIYGLLLAINMVAMFVSATRNNIVACVLVPIFITLWYSKRRIFILSGIVILLSALYINHLDAIKESIESIFRPGQLSNLKKISYFNDYLSLFSDAKVLWFGQGLGSYFHFTMGEYRSLTELTYFEFIRELGLILALPLFALLLYPLSKLRLKKYRSIHYLLIVYLFFLMMSFFNPLLISSSGMLLLSIVLYKVFLPVSTPYACQSQVNTTAGMAC